MRKLVSRAAVTGTAVAVAVGAGAALAPAAGAVGSSAAPTGAAVAHAAPAAKAAPRGTVAPYNGVCGAGYGVVNSAEIGAVGTVYLTYNSSTGNNCVVTIRNAAGPATPMVAELTNASTGKTVADSGNYTTYAGPVYLHAPGTCVNWSGSIGIYYNGKNGTNCAAAAR
jgi:hypothetical protein